MTTRDLLQLNDSHDERYRLLCLWADEFEMAPMLTNYHRLQVERFVLESLSSEPEKPVVVGDIGQYEAPRVWLKQRSICEDYVLLGRDEKCDVHLDMLEEVPAKMREQFDCIVCTEVLEHVADPWKGARSILGLLKPGGLLVGSVPFCWPDHRTDDYDDYWRFTEQGLYLLFGDFDAVEVHRIEWTSEGAQMYEFLRRFEGFGFRDETYMCTGHTFKARKGEV